MNYEIATQAHLPEILSMKNRVKARVIAQQLPIWQHGYPLDEFIIEDIEKGEGRVIVLEGKVVAYAHFHTSTDDEDYPTGTFLSEPVQSFGRLMVDDGYVGQGIARFLITKMIEEAKNLPVFGMGILVDDCNKRAVNLYKSFGFQKEGANQFPFAYLDIYTLYWV